MYIQILSYLHEPEERKKRLSDLKKIFELTAKAMPSTEQERDKFFYKYAGVYIDTWPDDVFFACDLESHQTIGYLIGCRDSQKAIPVISPLLQSYELFSEYFKKFPAHLHMNTHPDFQGQGVGTFLLYEYLLELKKNRIKAVHIVTSPEERNVTFYRKNKFRFNREKIWNEKKLLFMGRSV